MLLDTLSGLSRQFCSRFLRILHALDGWPEFLLQVRTLAVLQGHRLALPTQHVGSRAGVEAQFSKLCSHRLPQTVERQTLGHCAFAFKGPDELEERCLEFVGGPRCAAGIGTDRFQVGFRADLDRGPERFDKITRGVFEELLTSGYVAQVFVPPGERIMCIDGVPETRKVDVLLYAHAGRTLLAAAWIYRGQVTNFRTPGGGFAPVFVA